MHRKLLKGKRAASVFPAPCRAALFAKSYKKACQINDQATGKRLSVQTYSIVRKIRQVDSFLPRNKLARGRIREIHPEVCFLALAGRPMRYSKKSTWGFQERIQVLQSVFPQTGKLVDFALSTYRRRDVASDDVLDALVAAVTAIGGLKGLMSIPKEPEFDSRGLRMQIMFRPDHPM